MSGLFFRSAIFMALYLSGIHFVNAAICSYTVSNEWTSGFTATISINNTSDQAIDDWSVNWEYSDGSTVTAAWNVITSGSNPYSATPVGFNRLIAVGETVEFGFNGSKGIQGQDALIPQVTGSVCDDSGGVNTPPVVQATTTPSTGLVPFDVVFDASLSFDADDDTLAFLWDFGNGETSTSPIVNKTFEQAGNYTYTVTVSDGRSLVTESVTISAVDAASTVYDLDELNSFLYFVSTKNIHTVESHTFSILSGDIKNTGEATLTIDLSGVDTANTTRDQRMRDFLFDVTNFPTATVSLSIRLDSLDAMSIGTSSTMDVSAILNLHGIQLPIETSLVVSRLSTTEILVRNTAPIIVDAQDYMLSEGLEVLRSLAGLSVIAYAVPVNFTLVFSAR